MPNIPTKQTSPKPIATKTTSVEMPNGERIELTIDIYGYFNPDSAEGRGWHIEAVELAE